MAIWPHDDNASLIAFYGDPFSRIFAQSLTAIVSPWQMFYKDDNGLVTPIRHLTVHQKCAAAFTNAFAKIWDAYGHDQKRIEADNMQWDGGTYAPRVVRGSTTGQLSTHAFAAAIDIDPEHNPMNRTHTSHMPQVVIDAFKAEGAFWGGDFITRQDPMHFQFAHE